MNRDTTEQGAPLQRVRAMLRLMSVAVPVTVTTMVVALLDGDVDAGLALWALSIALVGAFFLGGDPPKTAGRLATGAFVASSWLALTAVLSAGTLTLGHLTGDHVLADPWNAWFETMSAFTTTGLTVVPRPQDLSATMQWWRSIIQWVGAVAVVLFAIFVSEPSGDRDRVTEHTWGPLPGPEDRHSALRIIPAILAAVTAGVFLGLVAFGVGWWRSINTAMTAAATGGLSVSSRSIGDLGGGAQVVIALGLTVSSISFATLWQGGTDRSLRQVLGRTQVRFALCLLAVTITAAAVISIGQVGIWASVFNTVSASATGGFSVGSGFDRVEALSLVATVSMFIGGAAGSTSGGVKVARVAWIAKVVSGWLPGDKALRERRFRWDGEVVDNDDALARVAGATSLVALWVIATVLGTLVYVLATDASVSTAGFEATSALSGTGLSRGITGPEQGWLISATTSVLMWVGRLEIVAVLAIGLQFARRSDG